MRKNNEHLDIVAAQFPEVDGATVAEVWEQRVGPLMTTMYLADFQRRVDLASFMGLLKMVPGDKERPNKPRRYFRPY